MRTTRLALVLTSVAVLSVTLVAPPATASCMLDDRPLEVQIEEATAVFKGRVTGLADDDRTARFAVEEVWKGPDLSAEVQVRGGPDAGAATSVDRFWTPGATYLVFPRFEDGALVDDSCSPTREWSAELAAARPANPRAPEDGTTAADEDGGGQPWPWIGVGVLAVALVGGAVTLGRRPA